MSGEVQRAEKDRAWLSVAELAEELGMAPMTIYRLIDRGEFPAVRVGRRLVIPARAIDALVDAAVSRGTVIDAAEWSGGAA